MPTAIRSPQNIKCFSAVWGWIPSGPIISKPSPEETLKELFFVAKSSMAQPASTTRTPSKFAQRRVTWCCPVLELGLFQMREKSIAQACWPGRIWRCNLLQRLCLCVLTELDLSECHLRKFRCQAPVKCAESRLDLWVIYCKVSECLATNVGMLWMDVNGMWMASMAYAWITYMIELYIMCSVYNILYLYIVAIRAIRTVAMQYQMSKAWKVPKWVGHCRMFWECELNCLAIQIFRILDLYGFSMYWYVIHRYTLVHNCYSDIICSNIVLPPSLPPAWPNLPCSPSHCRVPRRESVGPTWRMR